MTNDDNTIAFAVNSQTPKIRFLASLSDGRTVIQDNRPDERHAWARLSQWLKVNPEISITELRLQGSPGSKIAINMPSHQSGYFFGFKNQAVFPLQGPQSRYIGIGYYDGSQVHIGWYKQPNFDHSFTETRDIQKAGFFLIKNA